VGSVLITGTGGYVGGRLVATFLERGWEVRGLARDTAPHLGVEQTVCDLAGEDAPAVLREAAAGADVVVHLAGENEVLAASRPAAALAATVVATERVAEACRDAGVGRLLYLSTVHVYGARIVPDAVLSEDMRPEPRSAYAISRLASEHVAASLSAGSYELLVLRLTNAVGAPSAPSVNRWTLVANDLCRQGAREGELRLRSSGTQWRDFVSLGSVCGAIAAASGADGPAPAPGTYNLGSGQPTTVRRLAEMIQEAFEAQTGSRPPLLAPDPEDDPPGPYRVSMAAARDAGLRLDGSLSDAVAETVRFCLEHRAEL